MGVYDIWIHNFTAGAPGAGDLDDRELGWDEINKALYMGEGGAVYLLGGLGSTVWNRSGTVISPIIAGDNIETTGTGTFGSLDVDTLNFNGNVISDSTGTVSFDDDDIQTTGNGTFGAVTLNKTTPVLRLENSANPTEYYTTLTQNHNNANRFNIYVRHAGNLLGVADFGNGPGSYLSNYYNLNFYTHNPVTPSSANLRMQIQQAGEVKTLSGRIVNTTRIDDGDSPYTVLATDHNIFCDTDGGAITVNLPAGIDGTYYRIINCGSSGNDVTQYANGVEKLFGVASVGDTIGDKEARIVVYETTEGWW